MKRKSERLTNLYKYINDHQDSVERHMSLALWRWHCTYNRVWVAINIRTHKIDWFYADGRLSDEWYILLDIDNANGEAGPLQGRVREWYQFTPIDSYCGMMDKLSEDIENAKSEEQYDDWLAAQTSTNDF